MDLGNFRCYSESWPEHSSKEQAAKKESALTDQVLATGSVSVFGGTAPAVALYFEHLGHEDWF